MNTHSCNSVTPLVDRRQILKYTSCGFGWLAFAGLAGRVRAAVPRQELPLRLHGKATRVIFLCMTGGPSHLDTFDYKPKLIEHTGRSGPRPGSKLMGSKWAFKQHGNGGLWISELFPNLAEHADKLCLIRSMNTDLPAHPQAMVRLHTGTSQFVRPSLGSWTLYGLGSENQNLPGFVSITPSRFGGTQNYGSAFLPAVFQGTRIGNQGSPVAYAEIPNLESDLPRKAQRAELDFVNALNREKLKRDRVNPDVEGAIEAAELAFKMQSAMPEVMDLRKENEATWKLYGIGQQPTDDFGRKCLLARRLVENGVRFVEISHGNWDHHQNLSNAISQNCQQVDGPIAGLLADLKRRGLLDETLVIWTGEFGRTPYSQGTDGRDHNNKAFTLWMAGGGVKGGFEYGSSDDYGYEVAENGVSIHDLHATILALLGLDHHTLTYNYAGRDFRLTDVHGHVVDEIMA